MVPFQACWVLQRTCLVRKGQGEEPCIWFFVLIYCVVLVKTLISLGLHFIFSKKAMAPLALPDQIVPRKEKHTHRAPSFIRLLECGALG